MNNTIIQSFKAQVTLTPFNTALTDGHIKSTYEELDKKSDLYASYLTSNKGITSGGLVALSVSHNIDMIAIILAILKTGNGYIPIEPSFPPERIQYMLKESGASAIITEKRYSKNINSTCQHILIEEFQVINDTDAPSFKTNECLNDTAYLLYTSGSTGQPKGVIVTQKNVLNYVHAFKKEFHLTPADCILQNSVCTFDIFVEEVFPILLCGGTLAIPDENIKGDVNKLIKFMEKTNVSIVSAFPYFMIELNKKKIPKSLRLLISGGDVLRKEYITNLIKQVTIYNTYGPTETTVCATYYRCEPENFTKYPSIPIGKPIAGVNIYLLDKNQKPVLPGEIGEICISGKGVSKGYLKRPKETQETFVPNPFIKDTIMYKSGDLGIMHEDGNILFIKRKDSQVMIEGKRVEPLEIEQKLLEYEDITNTTVQAYNNERATYLVAYIATIKKINKNELLNFLKLYLPDFMIPKYFVIVPNIPLTINGKINTKELPLILS